MHVTTRWVPETPWRPCGYVVGVNGHESLLHRCDEESAKRDGVAYFLATRTFNEATGEWEITS